MSVNKSKPVYSPLEADAGGRYHLMLGCGPAGGALRRVLDELHAAAPGALQHTRILLAPGPGPAPANAADGNAHAAAPSTLANPSLDDLDLAGVQCFEDTSALLEECRSTLERSLMGTRLYIAGPESFIGRVMQIALAFNLNQDEVRAEALGTLARRVHCVHCRATTEDVRTNIARCSGCSRWLMVRDHYSRRFAAYLGVMVDAEAPGELPCLEELYP